jgi:NAD(P)-dependent dehydrogenase (short-subunit alcohol dehydrogenase family)
MTSAEKVVVVAGGTGGLGRAVSLAFLEDGARVGVTYRKQGELDTLKKLAAGNDSGSTATMSTSPTKQKWINSSKELSGGTGDSTPW